MAEIIEFPDVVSLVLTALEPDIDVPLGTLVPNPRPTSFVLARRSGGERTTLVTETAVVTVEAWADTPAAAADLAERCRARIHAMEGTMISGVPIYRVDDVGAPADLPDPLSDQPRYQLSVLIATRGSAPTSS